ncbi:MAG: sn-glycerol-1-phosphate dehydrogenase [Clostridiales bacterium]|nr:sn-glycerol-1-phosphate dehydrogenase [Clostridiales bacterium]
MNNISDLLVEKECTCGMTHKCNIKNIIIENDAISKVGELLNGYKKILLVADNNTYSACSEKLEYLFDSTDYEIEKQIFKTDGMLVPNEQAIEEIKNKMTKDTDLIIGVGSGVINDLCKYVSFINKLPYYIIATAPSMDGYASVGSALIIDSMKVTYNTHVPTAIIGDVSVLKNAPIDMVKAGFGDIIGKFSALNDWELSNIVNEEYFCEYVYDLVYDCLNKTIDLATGLLKREDESIKALMEALVIVGIAMSYVNNSRPASGSEHHLSHFFEIVGLLNNEEYLFHGIDVAYSTIITCKLREELLKLDLPISKNEFSKEKYIEDINKIYKHSAKGIFELQEKAGWYSKNLIDIYNNKWEEIKRVLAEVPTSKEIENLLKTVELDLQEFNDFYGEEKINNAIKYAKELKDRYTVLWIYNLVKI